MSAALPFVWMRSEDAARVIIATDGERAEVAPDREYGFDVPLYTAPPAAKIKITANEWAIDVLTEAKEIFEAQADDIDPSLMDVAHRCFCAINGLQQAAAVNRQDLIDLLIATRTQSEGVTADLIIRMIGAKPAVNQQLLEALQNIANPLRYLRREAEKEGCELNGNALHISNDPEFLKGIARAAIAAAQENKL